MMFMNRVFAEAMIRQSRSRPCLIPVRATLALLLCLSNTALAQAPGSEKPNDPAWCNCPAIVAGETEDLREQLIAETLQRQAECREAQGVDMTQQRKGQGARMDACRCSCLEDGAEPAEGPWGDKRKPARSGN